MPSKLKLFLTFLIIFTANFFVFSPSLHQIARGDQVTFLVETADLDDFPQLVNYTFSYCRSRVLDTGDAVLFRPLFYIFLSLEKFLFGYKFIYWQMAGIFLHLTVLVQLWRILMLIRPTLYASLVVLSFSLLFVTQEMVTWHHINGYLLCLVFILEAFYNLLRYCKGKAGAARHFRRMISFLILGCFTYEYTLVCCFIFPLVLVRQKPVISPWFLCLPPAAYAYFSVLDYALRKMPPWHYPVNFNLLNDFFVLVKFSAVAPFVPGFLHIKIAARPRINSFSLQNIFKDIAWGNGLVEANVILLGLSVFFVAFIGFIFLKRRRFNFFIDKILLQPASISLCLLLGYIFMVLLGRLQERDLNYLFNSLYHFYIVEIFLFIAAYASFFALEYNWGECKALLKRWVACILILMAAVNSYKAFLFNAEFAKATRDWNECVFQVDEFVRRHRRESGFAFRLAYFDMAQPGSFLGAYTDL